MISLVTFTGIDDRTDYGRVVALHEEFPFLEFGILLSLSPEDKDERYMTAGGISRAVQALQGRSRLALHICGSAVGEFVKGVGYVRDLADAFNRIQLNFKLDAAPFSSMGLEDAIFGFHGKVITQHFPSNKTLAEDIVAPNHQVLFDTSGGRGIATPEWLPPFKKKLTGYAGGLGPETVVAECLRIAPLVASVPSWIDMESRVRKGGFLDLDLCAEVARKVASLGAISPVETARIVR